MVLQLLLGKTTKNDITNAFGLVLVPAETVLDLESIKLLEQHRIDVSDIAIKTDYSDSTPNSDMKPVSNPSEEHVQEATKYIKDLYEQIRIDGKIPLKEIKNDLMPIVQKAAKHPDLFELFDSVKTKDEYTYQHNIGVGVLSTLIGNWLRMNSEEIAVLTLAATLHDIGKLRISEDILLKPGKLTDDEYDEMKLHTIYGYQMLKDVPGIDPRVPLVALQHHEREDGKGYPQRIKRWQIDPMSRIVAVADVFHAMSSKRPYHDALPFYEVVNQMRKGFFGELDPKIVSLFLRNMIRNLIGQKVKLSDGRWGEVVYINPHDDTHPLVKVGEEFLDLSKERQIYIQEIFF